LGLERVARVHEAAVRVQREVKHERDLLASLAEQALQRARVLAEGRARWGDDPFAHQVELTKQRDRLAAALAAASPRRRELQEQLQRLQQTAQTLDQLAREEAALAGDDPDEAVHAARRQVVEAEQAEQELAQQLADQRAALRLLQEEEGKLRRRKPLDLAADEPHLRAQRDAVEATLRDIDTAIARAQAQLQAVRDSTEFLAAHPPDGAAEPVCPVCRQALPESLRQRILAENAEQERQLREQIAQLEQQRATERQRLEREAATVHAQRLAAHAAREREVAETIARLDDAHRAARQALNLAERAYRAAVDRRQRLAAIAQQRAQLLATGDQPEELPNRLAAVGRDLAQAQHEEQEATEALRAVQEQLATVAGYIELLRMESQSPRLVEQRRLTLARRELLAELFATAAQATLDQMRAGALAAAYGEVARAWEQFMGWASVQVEAGAKGKLTVRTPSRALDLAQLSGGERAAFLALLHAHLGRYFARGGWLLLDEPLEHLDAANGRRLLEALQRACREGLLGQVVLATVETDVVRAALDPQAVHVVELPRAVARSA
jgi:DNA repair exonuclease SbcCD ATPase subunit